MHSAVSDGDAEKQMLEYFLKEVYGSNEWISVHTWMISKLSVVFQFAHYQT